MKILGILLLATATVTVTARHKKEWQKVDVKALHRERPQLFYKPNKPACSKGAGFYRDPQDCHQYIRCVDEFGTGQHFMVIVGRCEPGLVFDENVSACNWPQLAAPCSNSPDRLQEIQKPFSQVPSDNAVYEETNSNEHYPQQEVMQEPITSDSDTLQEEVSDIQGILIGQDPTEQKQQVLVEIQNPVQKQQQVSQENIAPAIQEQDYQEVQALDIQQQVYQENDQEQNNQYEKNNVDSSSEQFQQVLNQEISQQVQQDNFPQESQSEWWVPEDSSQNNIPEHTEQVLTSVPSEQPMFCSKDGFYRHPENCSQFIRCVEIGSGAFAVHFFECPKQLVFDEKDNACISADSHSCNFNLRKKRQAQDTKLRCKGEGFFRHPVDCRAFYRCVKTEQGYETHHFSCPANLVFDEEYTTCNWPEKAPPCNSQQQYKPTRKPIKPVKPQSASTTNKRPWSTSKPSNDFIDKSITQETYSKRRNTERPKSPTQSYETGAKCQRPGFLRNDNDCTKFHKCVKKGNRYIRYDLACPKNFAYDDVSQKCVAQRYATSCKRNKPYPPRQDDEETTVAPEASSTTSSNSGSENDAGSCEKEGYFRNPEDCNKFYRCVDFDGNGEEFVRYDFNCPEGLVFDEENSVCNWPDQSAPCDTRGSGGQGTGEDGVGTDGDKTGGSENEENDGRGSEGGENEVTTSSEPSTSKPVESTTSSSGDKNGGSSDQESDNDSGNDGSDNECTKEGFYRNPEDCNKFYRCVDFDGEGKEFVRYDFSCPEGLVFDESNSVCNWPSDSEPCDTSSSGNGNEGKDESVGTSSSTPSTGGEISDDGRDSSENQQTTPSGNEYPESTPDNDSSDEPTKDNSQSSTESSNGSTSSSKGSNGENSGECTEEGFFRNPEDCNKFYRCVDQSGNGQFIKYDFSCPEGLVFDEVNSVCNWPDQSAPCDGEGSSGEKGSTSQGEGEGSESSQSTTSSSRSTSTDTSEEITESGTSSTTEKSQSTDREYPKSTTERSTNTSPDSGESEGSSDSSGSESGSNQGECTEEGFFRNPEDCNKFYRCVDFNGDGQQFVRYDFECPEGLVFDEVNSVCNWPDQSPKCEVKGDSGNSKTTESGGESSTSQTEASSEQSQSSTEQSTEGSYESTQSSTERSTQTTQTSTEQSSSDGSSTSGDSSECTEEGFFRCKDDCNKFYRCVDEDGKLVRYDFKCPEGLIFDDKNKKCDWPSSTLTCESDTSSATTSSYETSTSSSYETSTSSSYETSASSSSTKSSTSSETSNKECTEEGYFRDPDDCSKYYRCIDEGDGTFTREDFSCAEDEVFDEEMRYCNRKDLAPPCDESQSQSTSSQTQTTASGGSTEGQSTTEKSKTTQTSTESSTKSDTFECSEPGFFRCPEDCTKFYRCVEEDGNLIRYDFHCPDGLIFDENNKKCDWPSSELTCDTESSSPASTAESSTGGGQTGGSTSQGTTSSGTTSSGGTPSSNECTEEGFFRNPDDCSKYYRCIDEGDGTFTREDFACEEDEVFDEEMRYCNRKDLAPPCDGSSSTTQSSESTSPQSSQEPGSSAATTSGSTGTTSTSSEESGPGSGTTSGSSASGECEEEGFHRDPNDCNKFYRCVDFQGDGQSFTRYDFECPEGLVFDETNDVCNWPSSVPSCESGNESRGSTKSDSSTTKSSAETSSESSDYSTSSSTSEEQQSTTSREQTSTTTREQTSTTTREQTSTTVSEQSSTTSRDYESTTEIQGTSSSDSSEGSTSSEKGTTSSGGTGSRGGSSDNIECTEEGFFRHPEDCSKFYRCVDFAGTGESYVRYDFDCPEGLHFDEVNSVCNWPTMSPSCESGSRASNGNKGSDESGESTSNGNSSTSSSSSSDTTTESSRTTRESESSTSTRDQTTRSSTSSTSSAGEFRCEEEGFFKHPTDCKKYYECKRDEDTGELLKIDCECPDGQVWDNEGWYCNAEELSPPCESSSNGSSFKCTEEGFFRDPEDCTRYYQCNRTGPGENDFSSERYQCDEGLVFDEEGRYCNAPELSEPCDGSSSTSSGTTKGESSSDTTNDSSSRGTTSSGSSSGNNNCTSEGFFRHPEDCTKYYQCSRNEETGEYDRSDYSCPDGRIFDEVSNYCNEPELSEQPCDSDSNGQSTTSTQRSSQSSSSSGGSSNGSTSSTGTRSGGPECTQEGFFRHPDDCNKFYRCVDFAGTGESFVRYDFDCPEGLHFDEVNSVCNWPTMTPPCESSNRVFLSIGAV